MSSIPPVGSCSVRLSRVAVGLLLCAWLVACDSGDGDEASTTDAGNTDTGGESPDDPMPGACEDCTGPSGGTITSDDGNLTLVIPEGALEQPTEVTATVVEDSEGDFGVEYALGPDGLQFATPITVERSFSLTDLPDYGPDDPEYSLGLVLTSDGDSELLDNVTTEINRADGTLTVRAEIEHFSTLRVTRGQLQVAVTAPAGEDGMNTQVVGTSWSVESEAQALDSDPFFVQQGSRLSVLTEIPHWDVSAMNIRRGPELGQEEGVFTPGEALQVQPASTFSCPESEFSQRLTYSLAYEALLTMREDGELEPFELRQALNVTKAVTCDPPATPPEPDRFDSNGAVVTATVLDELEGLDDGVTLEDLTLGAPTGEGDDGGSPDEFDYFSVQLCANGVLGAFVTSPTSGARMRAVNVLGASLEGAADVELIEAFGTEVVVINRGDSPLPVFLEVTRGANAQGVSYALELRRTCVPRDPQGKNLLGGNPDIRVVGAEVPGGATLLDAVVAEGANDNYVVAVCANGSLDVELTPHTDRSAPMPNNERNLTLVVAGNRQTQSRLNSVLTSSHMQGDTAGDVRIEVIPEPEMEERYDLLGHYDLEVDVTCPSACDLATPPIVDATTMGREATSGTGQTIEVGDAPRLLDVDLCDGPGTIVARGASDTTGDMTLRDALGEAVGTASFVDGTATIDSTITAGLHQIEVATTNADCRDVEVELEVGGFTKFADAFPATPEEDYNLPVGPQGTLTYVRLNTPREHEENCDLVTTVLLPEGWALDDIAADLLEGPGVSVVDIPIDPVDTGLGGSRVEAAFVMPGAVGEDPQRTVGLRYAGANPAGASCDQLGFRYAYVCPLPTNPWTVAVPAGGSAGAVNVAIDPGPAAPPRPAGAVSVAEVTVDQPTRLRDFVQIGFDTTGQNALAEFAILITYDGGASWRDALGVLDGTVLRGQAFQPATSYFVAAVELDAPKRWVPPTVVVPAFSGDNWQQFGTHVLDFTAHPTLAQIRRHRRIDDGSGDSDTLLEFDTRSNAFTYPRLQYKVSCGADSLIVEDVTAEHTARFSDSSPTFVDGEQRGDRQLIAEVTDGVTTDEITVTVRTAASREPTLSTLYLLSRTEGLEAEPQAEDTLAASELRDHFYAVDPELMRFGDRLILAMLQYSEPSAESGSTLLFRSLWDRDLDFWQELTLPGQEPLVSAAGESHEILGVRVVGKHLAVLANRYEAQSDCPGGFFPRTRSLELFIFDQYMRLAASRRILNVSVEHQGGSSTFSDAFGPTNFFLTREALGGFEVVVTGSPVDEENLAAMPPTCAFAGEFTDEQALIHFSATVSGDEVTLSEVPAVLKQYPDLRKHLPSYSSNNARGCRLANGGVEATQRYVWTPDVLALGVDRCRLSNDPQGAIVLLEPDGSDRLAEIPTDGVPNLIEGAANRILASSARSVFGTAPKVDPADAMPKDVNMNIGESQFFTFLPGSSPPLTMTASYPPRRPEEQLSLEEDCEAVYPICGDRLLCVRIDIDEESNSANDFVYTNKRVFLQGLKPIAGDPLSAGTERQFIHNGDYYIPNACPEGNNFEWRVVEEQFSALEPPTSTPVVQQCCTTDPEPVCASVP